MKKKFFNKIFIKQFGKFIVTGFINTGIDFGALYLLMVISEKNTGIYTFIFPAISFSIATINSFFLNRYWTFKQKKKQKKEKGIKDFAQFISVTLVGLLINSGITYIISNFIPSFFGLGILNAYFAPEEIQNLWVLFGKALATGVSLIWNFIGYKFWVFKK
jgi:putative flippase GtrA